MGEVSGRCDIRGTGGEEEENGRVSEWEAGLPTLDDMLPLSQGLVPERLLLAFNIRPVPCRTPGDVSRASEDTLSMIRGRLSPPTTNLKETIAVDDDIEECSDHKKKLRRSDSMEDEDSSAAAKTLKRHRLVWTPHLHKRFVEVVGHLGIKSAVPKTIMQLMNVEGLTRENVASHLQKYRLYLKRMHGGSSPPPPCTSSNTEQLFASTPAPLENSTSNGIMAPPMIPMSYGHGQGHLMGMGNLYGGSDSNYHHRHHHHHHLHHQQQQHSQYGNGMMMMMMQSGNKYGSVMPYHNHHHQPSHVPPGDN